MFKHAVTSSAFWENSADVITISFPPNAKKRNITITMEEETERSCFDFN